MRTILLFLLSLLLPSAVRADAAIVPLRDGTVIKLDRRLSPGITIDSVYMTVIGQTETDTIKTNSDTSWEDIHVTETAIILEDRANPEEYQFHFLIAGKWVHSPILYRNGTLSYHKLYIYNDRVTDATPFIGIPWPVYFVYLFFTIITEVLFARIFFRIKPKKMQRVIIGMNLVSHPLLWLIATTAGHFAYALSPVIFFFGEIAVTIGEAIVIRRAVKRIEKRENVGLFYALLVSFALNFASFIIGWSAYGFVGQIFL